MSYFFPAQAVHWYALEEEAGHSRIWGGIHYPIDDQAGRELGAEVAEDVIDRAFPPPKTITFSSSRSKEALPLDPAA